MEYLLKDTVLVVYPNNICFMPKDVYETYEKSLHIPRLNVFTSYIQIVRIYYERQLHCSSGILDLLQDENVRNRVYEHDKRIRDSIVFQTKVFAQVNGKYNRNHGIMVHKVS